jgi:hypothetical protein
MFRCAALDYWGLSGFHNLTEHSDESSRIVNYDTNGRLGLIGGPLEYLDNTIVTIQNIANKTNKDPNRFRVILLTYPNVDID